MLSSHVQVDLELVDLGQSHASTHKFENVPSLHFHRKIQSLGVAREALALMQVTFLPFLPKP